MVRRSIQTFFGFNPNNVIGLGGLFDRNSLILD